MTDSQLTEFFLKASGNLKVIDFKDFAAVMVDSNTP